TARLDALVGRAADLVELSNRIGRIARDLGEVLETGSGPADRAKLNSLGPAAVEAARHVARVSREVTEVALELSLQSFAEAAEGIDRIAHDLATGHGKQVQVDTTGGDVEVDRSIVAALREPLLHLVRNAVDHGIEAPADRRAAGKAEVGRITITARLDAERLHVEVADDGAGVDAAAVREAAGRSGLSTSDHDELVFTHGLSTAPAVSATSGRGIGLDAVRERLTGLGGSVLLRSEPGRGTVVTLIAPAVRAMTRVLVVRAGGQALAVPMTAVSSVMSCERDALREIEGRPSVLIDGSPVAVVPLHAAVGLSSEATLATGPLRLAVATDGSRRAAFAVDEFVTEAQVVVKPLGSRLAGLRTVMGRAVIDDGSVVLVVNVAGCLAAEARSASALVELDSSPKSVRSRILLAEDSFTTRVLEAGILTAAGYEVVQAADGAIAWDLLCEQGADLILSDIDMPGLDGVELCRRVRASAEFGDLPVVLVTSLASDEDRRRGLDAGADAYIVKSEFDQDLLLEIIERSL
ncbi:MAG TPA: response regulator, partial [Acidimicrobiales bacterium]